MGDLYTRKSNRIIPTYTNFYRQNEKNDDTIKYNIVSNFSNEKTYHHPKLDILIADLTSKKELKCILFVNADESLDCLYNHNELNPDLFHVVIFSTYLFSDVGGSLFTCISFNQKYNNFGNKLMLHLIGLLQPIVSPEIIFAIISSNRQIQKIASCLNICDRKIVSFIDYNTSKAFIYLFVHYLVTNGVVLKITTQMYNLIETIKLEDLNEMIKNAKDFKLPQKRKRD